MMKNTFSSFADAKHYQHTILFCTALIYLQLGLSIKGMLPFWLFVITMPFIIPRWMLAYHELFHIAKPEKLDYVTRLMPLGLGPIILGYRELRELHFKHHTYMCTSDDPELYQIRGSKLNGFLNASVMPEHSVWYWRNTQADNNLNFIVGRLVNFGLFAVLIFLTRENFWWYWIPARLSLASATYSFFYMLHRKEDAIGVYALHMPVWLGNLFSLIYGRDAYLVTCHHDIHHHNPRIAAHALGRDEPKNG